MSESQNTPGKKQAVISIALAVSVLPADVLIIALTGAGGDL